MGDGWSLQSGLIPSNGPTTHPDPRMHWKIGAGDIDSCPVRDRAKPQPRELNDRELCLVAIRMARERLLDDIDRLLADIRATLLRGRS